MVSTSSAYDGLPVTSRTKATKRPTRRGPLCGVSAAAACGRADERWRGTSGLKEINDTRGHAAGDAVLRQVVTVVKSAVREYDIVIRYGGDEFICGLLDLNLDDAANRFANTRKDLAGDGVAFSVGLAVLSGDDTLDDLIARADLAMYEQRRSRGSAAHYVGGGGRESNPPATATAAHRC